MVWEEKMFKGFLLWLLWQPELFMEHNYSKNLKEDHLRNIYVKFGKNTVNSFWGEVFLKEEFTDACTDERIDGQTDWKDLLGLTPQTT